MQNERYDSYGYHVTNWQAPIAYAVQEPKTTNVWETDMLEYETDERGIVPGVYHDVSFEEYCAWPFVNNSSLGPALRSVDHYAYSLVKPRKETDAFLLGHLVHTGKLEPLELLARYAVWPDFERQVMLEAEAEGKTVKAPRSTKRYKELCAAFREEVKPREPVSQDFYDRMLQMLASLKRNARSREYFDNGGDCELSIIWDDDTTGLRCKARVDHWNDKAKRATDLKTTTDAIGFDHSIKKYGYDRQSAFYIDGCKAAGLDVQEFCFVVVEKEPPFGVRAAPIAAESVDVGRIKYKRALQNVVRFKAGDVTGYENPEVWQLPPYELNQFDGSDVLINGERWTW